MLEIRCQLCDGEMNVARAPLFDEGCRGTGKWLITIGWLLFFGGILTGLYTLADTEQITLGLYASSPALIGLFGIGFGKLLRSVRKVWKCDTCGFIQPRD